MASPGPLSPPSSCAETIAQEDSQGAGEQTSTQYTAESQPRSVERDYDFVEGPSQDFFCPVTLELLLEPQLTSCCGHHLSREAATRLQREGKVCPMCNEQEWNSMLDKFYRRRIHELRVRCPHKVDECDWVGEVKELKRHVESCTKRPWECKYCGLKCTYGEGEGKHWATCCKFPEPCPNGCEVGSVERCNVEQHHSVCSLEPVACEMKEFGCSAVVPRKELATHMRESELQHLTAMTMLNLRLGRQLQQDLTAKDRKIEQLQQQLAEQKQLQIEMKTTMVEQKKEQNEMKGEIAEQQKQLQIETKTAMVEQKQELKQELNEMKAEMAEQQKQLQTEVRKESAKQMEFQQEQKTDLTRKMDEIWHNIVQHIEVYAACTTVCKVFTFDQYKAKKHRHTKPFYSQSHKFKFNVDFRSNHISAFLYLLPGDYDDQLRWPLQVRVHLELLNQAKDCHHIEVTNSLEWKGKVSSDSHKLIVSPWKSYADLEKKSDGVQYVMDDCLKFKLHLIINPSR